MQSYYYYIKNITHLPKLAASYVNVQQEGTSVEFFSFIEANNSKTYTIRHYCSSKDAS